MKPINRNQKYLPQLDGIRGLAILLVVTYHYLGSLKIFSFGWTGVDLFFVLSGYLITSRLIDGKQINSLYKFYRNRTLRIFPVYFFTLILFYTGFNFFTRSENLQYFKYYNTNWPAFALFCQNWLFSVDIPVANHLQHFWSIAVEEQFYLIWPLFLFIFLNNKHLLKFLVLLIITTIILRSVLYLTDSTHNNIKMLYNTFCRIDSFIIGALLYFNQRKNTLKHLQIYFGMAFFILVAGILFTDTTNSNPFTTTIGLTLIALVYAGLINSVTTNKNIFLLRLFTQQWIVLTGRISYGLYIYHWIILISLHAKLSHWLQHQLNISQSIANYSGLLICFALSYIISLISYFYFESFFLKLKSK